MQVTKLTENQSGIVLKKHLYTEEEMYREYDYYTAQKLLKNLLGAGLISEGEFNKITALNRQSFSPLLARIMP